MQTALALAPYAALLAGCLAAVVTDLRARKIPNAIPIALFAAAIVLHLVISPVGVLTGTACAIAMLLFGTVAFSTGWLGGGDVKLLAACCALIKVNECVPLLLATAIAGGVLALAVSAKQRRLREVLVGVATAAHFLPVNPKIRVAPRTDVRLPYAIAIAAGAATVTFLHTFSVPSRIA